MTTLEWSSDGYVLAVGWENGWAIFSVGGKCLASGFGEDEGVDKNKFQDLFMYGVQGLASSWFDLSILFSQHLTVLGTRKL